MSSGFQNHPTPKYATLVVSGVVLDDGTHRAVTPTRCEDARAWRRAGATVGTDAASADAHLGACKSEDNFDNFRKAERRESSLGVSAQHDAMSAAAMRSCLLASVARELRRVSSRPARHRARVVPVRWRTRCQMSTSSSIEVRETESFGDVDAQHRILRLHAPRADVHYVVAGDDAAPAVLMLHGFPDNHATWRGQIPPLVEAGYRIICPDLRGYGRSGKPAGVDSYGPVARHRRPRRAPRTRTRRQGARGRRARLGRGGRLRLRGEAPRQTGETLDSQRSPPFHLPRARAVQPSAVPQVLLHRLLPAPDAPRGCGVRGGLCHPPTHLRKSTRRRRCRRKKSIN